VTCPHLFSQGPCSTFQSFLELRLSPPCWSIGAGDDGDEEVAGLDGGERFGWITEPVVNNFPVNWDSCNLNCSFSSTRAKFCCWKDLFVRSSRCIYLSFRCRYDLCLGIEVLALSYHGWSLCVRGSVLLPASPYSFLRCCLFSQDPFYNHWRPLSMWINKLRIWIDYRLIWKRTELVFNSWIFRRRGCKWGLVKAWRQLEAGVLLHEY